MKVESAEFIRSAHGSGDYLRDGRPEVAFVGRSNVGKSSLLNRLLGRKGLARTSSTPGRTQAVNYFLINRRFYFVDLPGYGYAKAGKDDAAGVGGAGRRLLPGGARRARLVLLVDGNVGATPLDVAGVRVSVRPEARGPRRRHQDRPLLPREAGRWRRRDIRKALSLSSEIPVIPVSARSGDGIKELWGAIAPHLEASTR